VTPGPRRPGEGKRREARPTRVLLLTQLFQPEPNRLKGLNFARELVRRGFDVEVLTGFPSYPGGRIYPGYRLRPWMRETLDGVRITRVPSYPSHDRSALRRFLSYASFAAAAAVLGPCLVFRPDVVHVYQGPATLAGPAMVFRALFGAATVLDIQDLWPESVVSAGMLPLPGAAAVLGIWSKLTYRLAKAIVVLSDGYRSCLLGRGVPSAKIEVVRNWSDEGPVPAEGGPDGPDPHGLRGKFNIVYSGNFGALQDLDNVLAAAVLVEAVRSDIRFVFVGGGIEEARLKAAARERNLYNVLFIPRQAPEALRAITALSGAMLVSLRDDPLARMGIPQKTQAALASGKPILMAVRGSAAELVREAGAGLVCRPGNPKELAAAALALAELPIERLRAMGESGRDFYLRHLSFAIGVERMTSIFAAARPGAEG